MLAEFMAARYPHLGPSAWNRVVATLGSFFAYTTRQGWTPTSPAGGLERHRVRLDRQAHARSRAIPADELPRLPDRQTPAARQDLVVAAL